MTSEGQWGWAPRLALGATKKGVRGDKKSGSGRHSYPVLPSGSEASLTSFGTASTHHTVFSSEARNLHKQKLSAGRADARLHFYFVLCSWWKLLCNWSNLLLLETIGLKIKLKRVKGIGGTKIWKGFCLLGARGQGFIQWLLRLTNTSCLSITNQ